MDGEGGEYQNEVIENPGEDFIVFSDEQRAQLILITAGGEILANPLSPTAPISKPSITDDGSRIIFIGSDGHMHLISINWENLSFSEDIISDTPEWSNVAISKDGSKIAGVMNNDIPAIWIFNLDANPITAQSFDLENPTSADGISTGDVLYADALQFDFSNDNKFILKTLGYIFGIFQFIF